MINIKVQVVVFDISGDNPMVLILKTTKKRGSFWQNVTGNVDPGENPIVAAKRELQEETSYVADEIFYLDHQFEYNKDGKIFCEKVYGVVFSNKPRKILLDHEEHEDFKWKKIDEVTKEDYKYPSNYEAFILAKTRLKK